MDTITPQLFKSGNSLELNLQFQANFEPEDITDFEQMREDDMRYEAQQERQSYYDDRFDRDEESRELSKYDKGEGQEPDYYKDLM